MTEWSETLFLVENPIQEMKSYQKTWINSLTLGIDSISDWFLMLVLIIYEPHNSSYTF